MFCCVLEDNKIMNMGKVLEQITRIQQTRENAMRFLSRHPTTVLDSGFYGIEAPAPNPILPIDNCKNFRNIWMFLELIRLQFYKNLRASFILF